MQRIWFSSILFIETLDLEKSMQSLKCSLNNFESEIEQKPSSECKKQFNKIIIYFTIIVCLKHKKNKTHVCL